MGNRNSLTSSEINPSLYSEHSQQDDYALSNQVHESSRFQMDSPRRNVVGNVSSTNGTTSRQHQVTCLCPRCNGTLLVPYDAEIFRCQCGITLRLPTPTTIQSDRRQVSALLQTNQYSASCRHCGRVVIVPSEANSMVAVTCTCGSIVLTPQHLQLLLARLSSAARRSAQHAALVSMLPSFKYSHGSLFGTSNSSSCSSSCTICLSEYEVDEVLTTLPCFHSFHKECAEHWLREHRCCPLCNVPIDSYLEQERELVRG